MSFKGDTPGKKLARLETWRIILDALGKDRFLSGRYLFLAGPDMGDASVLLGLGVPPERLLGVDYDGVAAASATWAFPQVKVLHEDVLHTVERARNEKSLYDAIFLDFCAPIIERNLDTIGLALLEGLNHYGIIACTLLAGREQDTKGGVRTEVLAMRTRVETALQKLPVEDRQKWDDAVPYLARLSVLQKELLRRARVFGIVPVPIACVFYKSRSDDEYKGMPMCTYIARAIPNSNLSVEDQLRAALAHSPEIYFFDPTAKELGEYAAELVRLKYDPSLLLNATKGTVAAWKAHAARGTYKP